MEDVSILRSDSIGDAEEIQFNKVQASKSQIPVRTNNEFPSRSGLSGSIEADPCGSGNVDELSDGSDSSVSGVDRLGPWQHFDHSEHETVVHCDWNDFLDALDEKCDESDSDVESDNDSIDKTEQIREKLATWSSSYGITARAFTALLTLLSVYFPSLPKDSRTVMKTPRHVEVKAVGDGSYVHFGIVAMLTKVVSQFANFVLRGTRLLIQINIDGLLKSIEY